jgi:hypothetical protein
LAFWAKDRKCRKIAEKRMKNLGERLAITKNSIIFAPAIANNAIQHVLNIGMPRW